MACDPARDAYAYCTYLVGSNPCAREPFQAAGLDAEICGRADHDLLEISNISMNIAPIRTQIHDWIANDLPGPVVCDIATTTRLVHLDATRGEQRRRRNQMR